MYQINNFTNNDDVKLLDSLGPFTVTSASCLAAPSWPITATP